MAEERKRVGDYEIVRELGHGGMGQVYLVRNVISDRIEAMKVLLPDLAQQQELANRFMREIKLLASFEHPNIAQLRTAFTADNQLVMIMEYVEGDALSRTLSRVGRLTPARTMALVAQAADALQAAHANGIVHRDVKPGNVLIGDDGTAKIADFGISHAVDDVTLTSTGLVTGTPALQYSQNDTFTPSCRAFSTTIRFATDPSTVRFPANVLLIASASHPVCCESFGSACITGSNNNTAGTARQERNTAFSSAFSTASVAYFPCPLMNRMSSTRLTLWPTPNLVGLIFMSLFPVAAEGEFRGDGV